MDKISALMDGELDERETRQTFAELKQRTELRQRWDTFHLIGDAMRGERLLRTDLAGALAKRLSDEPTVLAPRRVAPRKVTTYILSAAASLAAVAFVGWVALGPQAGPAPQPELAVAQPPMAVPTPVVVAPVAVTPVANVPDEGRRNEYLLAHQGFSPSTQLQGVAPYIRSVSTRQSYTDR
jgi:sigma-E factor negative regulatory protein RseA